MSETFSRICVFCGSSQGRRPVYAAAARSLGELIARRSITLVYGGGKTGLMGTLADATLAAGGQAIGVMPRPLVDKEVAHLGLTELRVVASMHERKAMMADLADAFIVLPGGYGTFDEFCEILTWSQLMFHSKPCGLWNVEGYWQPLIGMFDHAAAEGFLRPQHRALPIFDENLESLLDRMEAQLPHLTRRDPLDKWWDRP
jgi:uncharacterized protein (TIGR00730 family)